MAMAVLTLAFVMLLALRTNGIVRQTRRIRGLGTVLA